MTSLPQDTAGDEGCALSADLLAQMDAAAHAEPLDAATQARIKQKLMRRIAQTSTAQHLTVPAGEEGWQPFGDGIHIKVLHEAGGVMSYLLRLAPGAVLPAHRHPVDEECVVVEGFMQIGALLVGAGGFHLGRKDLAHDDLRSPTGALLFLRGAVPDLALAL
jgi:quercetin dioxygenase-like cupin family protein